MNYLSWLAHSVVGVVRVNRPWMTWNLFLAFVPVLLGWLLLGRGRRRTTGWWAGVVAFGLFLPNAPYVVTDLVHFRADADAATSTSVLVFGTFPLYVAFVLIGYLAYLAALAPLVREVRSAWPSLRRWQVELPVHLACSLGIVLGRIARLNSWDTISSPASTLERTFATVTWEGAPAALLVVFVAVVLTTTFTRAVVDGVRIAGQRLWAAFDDPATPDNRPPHHLEAT